MTLHELTSVEGVNTFKSTNANTLICFSATWCGPCRQSKPQFEELASSYDQDPSLDVKVGIAYEHDLGDGIQEFGIRAFPTYVLFCNNGTVEKGRVQGVNFDGIRQMVKNAGCQKDLGEGYSLGGSGEAVKALSPEEARALRLAKFQNLEVKKPVEEAETETDQKMDTEPTSTAKKNEEETKPPADVEMKDASTIDSETKEQPEMVDPTESLSKEALDTLTGAMGFSLIRAQKGLLNSTTGVEGAVEWLLEHQDDADIEDPIDLVPKASTAAASAAGGEGLVARSYKCNTTGKIFRTMADLELHANRTGHTDFEECTEEVKPLTPEEKAAKIIEIKALLKAKREERQEAEKVENVDREKQRRFMGKEMSKTREEVERSARQREVMLRKKEKEESKRERERIRRELEKDKMERRAHKGKLTSKLGVDGYNPDAIQYDVNEEGEATKPKPKPKASAERIDEYINKVKSYRAGGDGGKCLKILLTVVKNAAENPNEEKFKSVSMESKVYKSKIKPFLGAKSLLLAIGFTPNEEGDHLVLSDEANMEVLSLAKEKLAAAYASY